MYWTIFSSVDHCFGKCVTHQSVGNWKQGWKRGVLPLYINWRGKKLPLRLPQNTAVIYSFETKWIPVWSQFITSSGGTSSMVTTATMSTSSKKVLSMAAKSLGYVCFLPLWPFSSQTSFDLADGRPTVGSTQCGHRIWLAVCGHATSVTTSTEVVTTLFWRNRSCNYSVLTDLAQVQLYLFTIQWIDCWHSSPTSRQSRHWPLTCHAGRHTWWCRHELLAETCK